jgi:integrase
VGDADRPRPSGLRHAQPAPDEVALTYRRTGNLRACQLLLGHTTLESTVRYLGIEADDALVMSEQADI